MRVYRHKGAWWIDTRCKGRGGRIKVGSSRKQAKAMLDKARYEMNQRDHFPAQFSNERSFSAVADKMWKLHGSTLRSVKSWKYLHAEVRVRFGNKRMGSISTADIQAFYNEVKARTCSTSANKRLTWIKLIFNCARKWGDFYGENPCKGVHKERDRDYAWRFLSREEIDRLLRVAHPRLFPVLACALLTGMRRGEILDLNWRDVDLQHGFINLLKTKSGKRREIHICTKLHDVFVALGPKPEGNVFNLPKISLRKYFARALKEADIKGRFRFHDLRHTYASHYAMTVRDLAALQSNLGHCTPSLTMRYTHLSNRHLVANNAAFESAIPIPQTADAKSDLAAIWHQPATRKD